VVVAVGLAPSSLGIAPAYRDDTWPGGDVWPAGLWRQQRLRLGANFDARVPYDVIWRIMAAFGCHGRHTVDRQSGGCSPMIAEPWVAAVLPAMDTESPSPPISKFSAQAQLIGAIQAPAKFKRQPSNAA